MQIIDPGHAYGMEILDYPCSAWQTLYFVKREGPGYPGNIGHRHGVIIQEVLRCCIDRIKYLEKKISHPLNEDVLKDLRDALFLLECRAADRHGASLILSAWDLENIETLPVGENGHLLKGAGGSSLPDADPISPEK
jgi:hypothetical protein